MPQARFTLVRNQKAAEVVIAAGSVVAADTIQVNFDYTNMTRLEAVHALEQVCERVLEGKWPPL